MKKAVRQQNLGGLKKPRQGDEPVAKVKRMHTACISTKNQSTIGRVLFENHRPDLILSTSKVTYQSTTRFGLGTINARSKRQRLPMFRPDRCACKGHGFFIIYEYRFMVDIHVSAHASHHPINWERLFSQRISNTTKG